MTRQRILDITTEELQEIKTKFATPRRTVITAMEGEIDVADLVANNEALILLTSQGYIKRLPVDTFASQNRATRGKAGNTMKDDDTIEHFLACRTHDYLLFFTDRGKVYSLRAYEIAEGSRTARGSALVQMLQVAAEEKITSLVSVSEFCDEEYLVMLTAGGFIKKTRLSAFSNIRANGLIAIALNPDDQLRWVRRATSANTILIGSKQGMAIRFRSDDEQLRPMGRDTKGVRSMTLKPNDQIVSMTVLPAGLAEVEGEETEDETIELEENIIDEKQTGPWVLVVTQEGYGKRVPVNQFRIQKRAGKGLRLTKFKSEQDSLAALRLVDVNDEIMIITSRGVVMRQSIDVISCQSRTARGVRLQRLDSDDVIVATTLVPPALEDE